MKIKKLTIHNIASIEDAVIEFNKEPLADEPLFLISGETGSGKTTILNAICLALYNTAPNLENIPRTEDAENIMANNPRQLMRRGTGEAFVELVFDGNDNREYAAVWSVQRARKQPEGALQNVKRSLECRSRNLFLQKDGEIKLVIEGTAVGLDFDQFCRTTMLAQGQFSKFMNSKENDKSDILEKLTQTEIFARIGKRIFEKKKEAEEHYQSLSDRISGAQLLSQNERDEILRQIGLLETSYRTGTLKMDILTEKLKWLASYEEQRQKKQNAEITLQKLIEQLNSEEIQKCKSTLELWDKSHDIHRLLTAQQTCIEDGKKKKEELNHRKNEYSQYVEGLNFLKKNNNALREKLQSLEKEIEKEKPHATMYENAGKIETLAHSVIGKEKTVSAQNARIAQFETDRETLSKKREQMLAIVKNTVNLLATQTEIVHRLSKATQGIDTQAMQQAVETHRHEVDDAKNAIEKIIVFHNRETDVKEAEKSFGELKNKIEKEKQERDRAVSELPEAERQADALKNRYEGKQDLRNHIVELRHRFHDTKKCPLCGSDVADLHSDEVLDRAVSEAGKMYEDADLKLQNLRQQIEKTEVHINTYNGHLQTVQAAMERAYTAFNNARDEGNRSLMPYHCDVTAACLITTLENIKKQAEERLNEAQKLQSEAIEKVKNLETARNEEEQRREANQCAEKELKNIDEQMQECEREITQLRALTAQAETDRNSLLQELQKWITVQVDWTSVDIGGLSNRITNNARRFNNNREQWQNLGQKYISDKNLIDSVGAVIDELNSILGEPTTNAVREMKDIQSRAGMFKSSIDRLNGGILSIETNYTAISGRIEDYFNTHTDIDKNEVLHLLDLTTETMDNYRKKIAELSQKINLQKGKTVQINMEIDHLNKQKPEMTEEDSKENLTVLQQELQKAIQKDNDDKVALQTMLSDNERREKDLEKEKEQLLKWDRTRRNWLALDGYFGGANGEKFKRIAQTYVLRNLLENANYYMRNLNRRYELAGTDNSLAINVKDNYQGGAVRNVGSLSGGESFIASLALALGLSSISKDKIQVDTLFIDEGFGTLSKDYLDTVIEVLDKLHRLGGRKVGIISHVEELKNRIGTQIQVVSTRPSTGVIKVVQV